MTHKEFHLLAAKIANGRYYTTTVDVSTYSDGRTTVNYKGYIDGVGWAESEPRPEDALERLAILSAGVQRPDISIDAIDPVPEAATAAL